MYEEGNAGTRYLDCRGAHGAVCCIGDGDGGVLERREGCVEDSGGRGGSRQGRGHGVDGTDLCVCGEEVEWEGVFFFGSPFIDGFGCMYAMLGSLLFRTSSEALKESGFDDYPEVEHTSRWR